MLPLAHAGCNSSEQSRLNRGQLALALENFNVLVNEIAESPEAQKVKPRLDALAAVVSEIKPDFFVEDPMARTYLAHGDFWAREKAKIFQIDASWIDQIDAGRQADGSMI